MSARPTKRAKAAKAAKEWLIYRMGGRRGEKLGIVTAADEASAVVRAIEEFDIPPSDRNRLLAQRIRLA